MENLIKTFQDIGYRMSYFNAAESSYREETDYRNACREELRLAGQALIEAGLNPDDYTDQMLISKSDYTSTAIKRNNEENKNV